MSLVKGIKIYLNMHSILNNKCAFPAFVKRVGLIVSIKDMFAIDKMARNHLKSFERLIVNTSLNPLEYAAHQYT